MRWFSAALEIGSRRLAAVLDHVIADLLAIAQRADARTLHRGDVDEDVLRTIIRLNEAITLLGVEPFDCTSSHSFPLDRCTTFAPRELRADDRRQTSKGMRPGRSSVEQMTWPTHREPTSGQYGRRQTTLQSRINDRFAARHHLPAWLDLHRGAESQPNSLSLYFCVLPEKRRK